MTLITKDDLKLILFDLDNVEILEKGFEYCNQVPCTMAEQEAAGLRLQRLDVEIGVGYLDGKINRYQSSIFTKKRC